MHWLSIHDVKYLYFKIQSKPWFLNLNIKPWLKEVRILIEGFFYVPKKKTTRRRRILLMLGLMRNAYGFLGNIDQWYNAFLCCKKF